MLDRSFANYTPGSRRWYEFAAAGEMELVTAEARRTAEALGASAALRLDKGQLTEAGFDDEAAAWGAIVEDLVDGPRNIDRHVGILAELHVNPKNGITWAAKVAALRGEIEARRGGYEAAIAKGQLTKDQARQQLERLEALHDLYWRHLFAYDGTLAERRALSQAITDEDVLESGPSSRAEQPAQTSRADDGATPSARSTTAGATE